MPSSAEPLLFTMAIAVQVEVNRFADIDQRAIPMALLALPQVVAIDGVDFMPSPEADHSLWEDVVDLIPTDPEVDRV